MTFKLAQFLALTALMSHSVLAHKAHSFQHFHGPLVGADHLASWTDKYGHHHHHHHDYVARPKYDFSYGVQDHHTKDNHGQKEHGDGKQVSGDYSLHEPGGNVRTVKYHAGKHGFHAHVHNSNGNDHSGGSGPHGHHTASYVGHDYNNGLSGAYGGHGLGWHGFGRYGHWHHY